jgi:uncharacterized membrane protein YeaQ/YmgE (transglycosylase-associated protein family)
MTITDLIIFLVIGAVAGWLAGVIMKGGGYGLVGDIIVGVIGSLIGGWLFGLLGIAAGGFIGSIIAAVVGGIILIANFAADQARITASTAGRRRYGRIALTEELRRKVAFLMPLGARLVENQTFTSSLGAFRGLGPIYSDVSS